MRVFHVITRLIIGGAQENTVASVLGLRRMPGLDVLLVSGPTRGPEGSLEPEVAAIPGLLAIVPNLVRPVHPLKDAAALRGLVALFRLRQPDIVHTHSGKAGILGRIAARRAGVPVIIHTIHGPSFGSFQGALANAAFRAAERYAARFTTHFVVVANAMSQQYRAAGIGRPEQFTRIFSGFDLDRFLCARSDPSLRQQLGLGPNDFVVGKIARLFKLKGHDDLLAVAPRVIPQCRRLKFLLVGDGAWRARFERLVRARGLAEHFVFAGLIPPAQIPRYLGVMDALVHLSRREGLPRALPQALAAGRPVIAYDCDGAREVCIPDETGFLIPPGDLPTLARRLLQLADDPALRERLAQRGRNLAREQFSVGRMVADLHALYLKLTGVPGRMNGAP
jgi:glycosyltransferase involved in cell wall biosynthesis